MKEYRTESGDTWDLIAHKALGDAMLMDRMIRENPEYCEVYAFPAGILLTVPEIEEDAIVVTSPWFTEDDDA